LASEYFAIERQATQLHVDRPREVPVEPARFQLHHKLARPESKRRTSVRKPLLRKRVRLERFSSDRGGPQPRETASSARALERRAALVREVGAAPSAGLIRNAIEERVGSDPATSWFGTRDDRVKKRRGRSRDRACAPQGMPLWERLGRAEMRSDPAQKAGCSGPSE
jgi:hypothetical protein